MQRSIILALLALAIAAPALTQQRAMSPPADLRSAVYSRTAAELFWKRAARAGFSYEISRDGTLVATSDGTSYFTEGLAGGRSYTFDVVAIDPDGRRSAPASVTLVTQGERVVGDAVPETPQAVRLEVYSPTAAELFWERAPAGQRVVTTEISRDGERIGVSPGTSFFDDEREPGVAYRYTLVAVDKDGGRSPAASLPGEGDDEVGAEDTGGDGVDDEVDGDGTIIGVDTYENVLANLFDLIEGGPFERIDRVALALHRNGLAARRGSALPGVSLDGRAADEDGGDTVSTYGCGNGGEYLLSVRSDGRTVHELDQCALGGGIVSGTVTQSTEAGVNLTFAPLEVLYEDGSSELLAGVRDVYEARGVLSLGLERATRSFTASLPDGRTLSLSRSAVDVGVFGGFDADDAIERRLSVSLDVEAPWTGGQSLSVASADEFEALSTTGNYRSGSLRATAADGSTLVLDAANGDPRSYQVDVIVEGTTSSFTRPWTSRERLLCLRPTSEDDGSGCAALVDGVLVP